MNSQYKIIKYRLLCHNDNYDNKNILCPHDGKYNSRPVFDVVQFGKQAAKHVRKLLPSSSA